MKKVAVVFESKEDLSSVIGTILSLSKNKDILLFAKNVSSDFITEVRKFIPNVLFLSFNIDNFKDILIVNKIDTAIISSTDSLFINHLKKSLSFLDIMIRERGFKLELSANLYIETTQDIKTKEMLIHSIGLNSQDYLLSDNNNGYKCSKPFAESYEMTKTKNTVIDDIVIINNNVKYLLTCFTRGDIGNLKHFEAFLKDNKRDNKHETTGDFHKSFLNKQNNSNNIRYIFVLFKYDSLDIVGTRTIEDSENSLELDDFTKRDISLTYHTHKHISDIKIAGDLVVSKDLRGIGLGKNIIVITNKIAKENGWDLFGSTGWKDTKSIYKHIGIHILDQKNDSIKYKWCLE